MGAPGLKDKVQYNVTGQTLSFEAPQGRPSGDGTVTLYDRRYEQGDTANNPIVTGTATRASISTTLNGSAGASQSNPKTIPLTAIPAALNIGDFVWVTNASQQRERVRIAAIGASSVTAEDALEFDYASGATFESAVMTSPAITAAWIQDEDNIIEDCYAVWVYAVDGVTYRTRTRFDVVREVIDWQVFDSDLLARFPDLKRYRFEGRPDFQPQVQAAVAHVDALLEGIGRDPDRVRGNEMVKLLVALYTFVMLAGNGVHPPGVDRGDFFSERKEEWEKYEGLLLRGALKIPYDIDNDDVVQESERRTVRKRIIR